MLEKWWEEHDPSLIVIGVLAGGLYGKSFKSLEKHLLSLLGSLLLSIVIVHFFTDGSIVSSEP